MWYEKCVFASHSSLRTLLLLLLLSVRLRFKFSASLGIWVCTLFFFSIERASRLSLFKNTYFAIRCAAWDKVWGKKKFNTIFNQQENSINFFSVVESMGRKKRYCDSASLNKKGCNWSIFRKIKIVNLNFWKNHFLIKAQNENEWRQRKRNSRNDEKKNWMRLAGSFFFLTVTP